MRSASLLLFASLFLISCTQYSLSNNQDTLDSSSNNIDAELLLNSISFDHGEPNRIRQIVFSFNQNIAIVGAVPTRQQINSIRMSHNLAKQCTWRFIDLFRLACELKHPLRVYTDYSIEVSDEFSALGRAINILNSPQANANIKTNFLPDATFWVHSGDDYFPKSIEAYLQGIDASPYTYSANNSDESANNTESAAYRQSVFALLQHVELLAPNGKRHKVSLSYTNEKRENSSIRILLPLANAHFINGRYKLILAKNFASQLANSAESWQFRTLDTDDVLLSFEYRTRPEFIGFICSSKNKNTLINTDYLNANIYNEDILYAMPCPPEHLGFAFSRPVKNLKAKAPPIAKASGTSRSTLMSPPLEKAEPAQLEWLQGPEYQFKNHTQDQNMYIYHLALQGFAQYSLNLNKVIYQPNIASNQERKIQFVTQEATTQWYFQSHFGTVIESESGKETSALPMFERVNVPNMQANLKPISSPDALLLYLNGDPENRLTKQQITLPPTEHSPHTLSLQSIDVKQVLGAKTGLVAVELSGTSTLHNDSYFQPSMSNQTNRAKKSGLKKEVFVANAAGFNVAVWHQQDLLVQAINWQAKALANASVQLVCESQQSPTVLGNTDAQGLLFIDAKRWQAEYASFNDSACWLWLQSEAQNTQQTTQKQSSAIELPKASIDSFTHIKASAYTAQPIYEAGDKVHIGFLAFEQMVNPTLAQVEDDSFSAIRPFQQLADYTFSITTPNQEPLAELAFATVSAMGFSESSYTLPKHMLPGNYSIVMRHITTGDTQSIGNIRVAEFSPPEFEQTLDLNEVIKVGSPIKVKVQAKRMNGLALVKATSNLSLSLSRTYRMPENWPQNYEYSSYTEFNFFQKRDASLPNKQSLSAAEHFTQRLDDSGRTTFTSEAIQSHIPFAQINLLNEVVASDGMALNSSDIAFYVGREYLIGTQHNTDTNQLELIAINAQGKAVRGVAAKLIFTQRKMSDNTSKSEYVKIGECVLDALPASCPLNAWEGSFKINISSHAVKSKEPAKYTWFRDLYISRASEKDKEETLSIKLTSDKKRYRVGETIPFNLQSTVAGTATLILESGTIRKTWQQPVKVGANTIELKALGAWLSSVRLYASLALSRDTVADFIKKQSAVLEETPTFAPERWPHQLSNIWRNSRLLTSASGVTIIPNTPKPNLQVKVSAVSSDTLYAGSEVNIEVSANNQHTKGQHDNSPIEAQLWLVNEALWPFTNTSNADYNLDEWLYGDHVYHRFLVRASLNQDLIYVNNQSAISADNQEGLAMRMRAPSPAMSVGDTANKSGSRIAGMYLNPNSALYNKLNKLNPDDFAQSKWLGKLVINANKSETLTLKLPQLIGRWKVLVLSANNNQTALNTTSFNTVRKREYFVDAPRDIYANDTSRIAITQINNSNKALQDDLSIWINGKLHTQIKNQLAAQEHQRLEIDLPKLPLGENTLVLTSKQETDYVAMHVVNVKDNTIQQSLTWLQPANTIADIRVTMPPSAIRDSIALSYMDSTNLQPNWQTLAQYNINYPHTGWEQTLSRAVAYKNTPQAFNASPKGEQKLKDLLAKQALYTNETGTYSYYTNQASDAFLSAYTYLAHAWLQNTPFEFRVDNKLVETLREYISNKELTGVDAYRPNQFGANNQILTQSMALLALAKNKDISLDEALIMRQRIGSEASRSNLSAIVLQGLALKHLGAQRALYTEVLQSIQSLSTTSTYQDTYSNLFNQNSDKCYLAMLHEQGSLEQTALIQELLAEQANTGHFGSTFANAVCSQVLASAGYQQAKPDEISSLKFSVNKHEIIASQPNERANTHLYRLAYKQTVDSLIDVNNGISINRTLWVKRGGKWEKLTHDQNRVLGSQGSIKIGDLIKTELVISSARSRQHIAVIDAIAGGFEAVNPDLSNKLYRELSQYGQYNWRMYNHFTINDGLVLWQLGYLAKGQTSLVYYSRVRHSGEFMLAPASAEAMYRNDINASGRANKVQISQ